MERERGYQQRENHTPTIHAHRACFCFLLIFTTQAYLSHAVRTMLFMAHDTWAQCRNPKINLHDVHFPACAHIISTCNALRIQHHTRNYSACDNYRTDSGPVPAKLLSTWLRVCLHCNYQVWLQLTQTHPSNTEVQLGELKRGVGFC